MGYGDLGDDTVDSRFDGSSSRNEFTLWSDSRTSECTRVAVADELRSPFLEWDGDMEGKSVQAYEVNCRFVYTAPRQSLCLLSDCVNSVYRKEPPAPTMIE